LPRSQDDTRYPGYGSERSDHVWGLDELIGLLEIAEEIKQVA